MELRSAVADARRVFLKYRNEIINEVLRIDDLMYLITKGTYSKWTKEESALLKSHFQHLAKRMPVLALILAPGGMLLLPILAEVLERRKTSRPVPVERRRIVDANAKDETEGKRCQKVS